MKFETYNSPRGLMNGIRFMVIERIDGQVMKLARMNPLYRKIVIRNPSKPNPPKSDSISVYVEIDVLPHDDPNSSLEIIVRLSDHDSRKMTDGEIIRDNGEFTAFILRNIGDAIRIRARNGVEHRWNDLDWKTELTPLIQMMDVTLPGSVFVDGADSEYYIDPSMKGKVGAILNNVIIDVMGHIHTFIHQREI